MDTTLRLESLGALSCHFSEQAKRKLACSKGNNGLEHGISLELGLGTTTAHSLSSSVTSSSMKEADDDDTSDDALDLNFQFPHVGNNNSCLKKPRPFGNGKISSAGPAAPCNLQLSLLSGPSSSVISNASLCHSNHQATSALLQIDEGSTSSRWKPGVASMLCFSANHHLVNDYVNWTPRKSGAAASVCIQISANTPVEASIAASTSGISKKLQAARNTKTCQFQGCSKGARGASGLCIAHGGGRRCQREGCHKGAEGRTVYCKAHGGGRRCQSLGCTKSAEGRTDFCIAHGGGRRCSQDGCARAARGKSGLCIRHGGGKRCRKENCTKSAEGYSGFCISHGGGRRCQFPECNKGAQGSTMYCKAHGGGKRCTAEGCNKGAEGSTPFCKGHGGGKRCTFEGGCHKSVHGGTLFCVAHGGGKRCAEQGCTKSARGRTNFCVRHGGGKRCQFEGCGKSAQGRTDFCKAHGGGKRCSRGQLGSGHGVGELPCDRFARSKTGLCTAHSSTVLDGRAHGAGSLSVDTSTQDIQLSNSSKMKDVSSPAADVRTRMGQFGHAFAGWNAFNPMSVLPQQAASLPFAAPISLPEGRVHGGSLMALLGKGASLTNPTAASMVAGTSSSSMHQEAANLIPQKWV